MKKKKKKKVRRKSRKTRRSAAFKLEHQTGISVVRYPGNWSGQQEGALTIDAVARPNSVILTFHSQVRRNPWDKLSDPVFEIELWNQDAKSLGRMLQDQSTASGVLTYVYKQQQGTR